MSPRTKGESAEGRYWAAFGEKAVEWVVALSLALPRNFQRESDALIVSEKDHQDRRLSSVTAFQRCDFGVPPWC